MNEHLMHAKELAEKTIGYMHEHKMEHPYLDYEEIDILLDAVKIIRLCEQHKTAI